MWEARNGNPLPLYRSMRKYGVENFKFKVSLVNIPERDLDYYERLWIEKLHTTDRRYGYNIAPGGGSLRGAENPMYGKTPWNKGIPRTPEEKAKMSAAQKKNSKEISARTIGSNNPMYGKKMTSEQKAEFSKKFSGENNPFYGKFHSDKTKQLIKEHHIDDAKPVVMKDLATNEVIKEFTCLHDAARYIDKIRGKGHADKSFISNCAKGKHSYAYGYAWSFSERCND